MDKQKQFWLTLRTPQTQGIKFQIFILHIQINLTNFLNLSSFSVVQFVSKSIDVVTLLCEGKQQKQGCRG